MPLFQVRTKETFYYFTIKCILYCVITTTEDFSKQSLYYISFSMKSFNPNSFLSESLTHARKMEVGIYEERELDGGDDEESEVREGRNRKGRGCRKNHRKLLCIYGSCVDCIFCHHHTQHRPTPAVFLSLLCRKCLRRSVWRCSSPRPSSTPLTRPQKLQG